VLSLPPPWPAAGCWRPSPSLPSSSSYAVAAACPAAAVLLTAGGPGAAAVSVGGPLPPLPAGAPGAGTGAPSAGAVGAEGPLPLPVAAPRPLLRHLPLRRVPCRPSLWLRPHPLSASPPVRHLPPPQRRRTSSPPSSPPAAAAASLRAAAGDLSKYTAALCTHGAGAGGLAGTSSITGAGPSPHRCRLSILRAGHAPCGCVVLRHRLPSGQGAGSRERRCC
jgi:hypothetical protein